MAEPPPKNGPSLTWGNIIITLTFGTALFVALFTAQWAIFNQQTENIRIQTKTLSDLYEKRHDQLVEAIVKINSELSHRKDAFRAEFWTRDEEIIQQKGRDEQWKAEHDRDNKFVTIDAFQAYTKLRDSQFLSQQVINQQAIDAYVNTKAYDVGMKDRDKLIENLTKRIEQLEHPQK